MCKSFKVLVICFITLFCLSGCKPKKATTSEDFAISFRYGVTLRNLFDTSAGKIQKDLINGETADAPYSIPDKDLKEIRSKLHELKIDEISKNMTSENLTKDDTAVMMSPCERYIITVTDNGKQYTVEGDQTVEN